MVRYVSRKGSPYPRLSSADEALERYASVVHAVGVRLEDDAPFGLDDVFAIVVRPNRALDNAVAHRAKAQRAQAIWPEVAVIPLGRCSGRSLISTTRAAAIHGGRGPAKRIGIPRFPPREQGLEHQLGVNRRGGPRVRISFPPPGSLSQQ